MFQSPRALPRGLKNNSYIHGPWILTECTWSKKFTSHLPLTEHVQKHVCYQAILVAIIYNYMILLKIDVVKILPKGIIPCQTQSSGIEDILNQSVCLEGL